MIRYALAATLFWASPATAQHAHTTPNEVGQFAFAALSEIVDLLRKKPLTDWDAVDIPTLQSHLDDMQLVIRLATAVQSTQDGMVQFKVTVDAPVIDALYRMVPAHAPFLDAETGWSTDVERHETGVTVRVRGDQQMIKALGFHGLMTIGAHHQQHHLGIAMGSMAHH